MGMVLGKTGVAEPAFDLLLQRPTTTPYEIRRYATRFAIETEYGGGKDGAGFMTLAGYIGVGSVPQNEGQTSIAMTAPVITEKSSSKGGEQIAMTAPVVTSDTSSGMKKMQFILPAEYDAMSKIPKPTNSRVSVVEVKPAVGAVHRFSGLVDDTKAQSKAKALVEQLKKDGVEVNEEEVMDNYLLWQFNPPFTVPFLRRNEVWIELKEKDVKDLMKNFNDA